jgi:N-acetyl-gamma-glutamyl-phosphate reductase common form
VSAPIPAVVLGGTGYVAGELLRLIGTHPRLKLAAVMSDSAAGQPVAAAFPHLVSTYPQEHFCSEAQVQKLLCEAPQAAVFCAAPHGASAGVIDRLLTGAEQAGTGTRVVDLSADFRYASAATYEAVYQHPHGAPHRLAQFSCALPEHLAQLHTRHVGHPGCFATAILLASVPLLAAELITPALFVSGITGSTGSGRKPADATHHPLRHADLYSYGALTHRHVPEVIACARAASGREAELAFVPHSGPFARGVHVTVQATARRPLDTATVLATLREFYARAPFVHVAERAPHVKEVATSNYAHLSAVARGNTVTVLCAIDNLVKGAAGGAIQWMNRMLDLPETAGLTAAAPGWT